MDQPYILHVCSTLRRSVAASQGSIQEVNMKLIRANMHHSQGNQSKNSPKTCGIWQDEHWHIIWVESLWQIASSSFTLFCSIKTFCWTHGTGWEEMEAIGFTMLLGTSFWTMERATSPCSVACMLVTHSRLPTVCPTKQLSLKSMNWTGRTIAPPLPAFQTSPHRPPAMHEAHQNLGTLDKPHNITFFLTVAWLYPLLAVSSTMVYSSLCYSTPLHPTLLFSALLYSSLLFPLTSASSLYSSLLSSTHLFRTHFYFYQYLLFYLLSLSPSLSLSSQLFPALL